MHQTVIVSLQSSYHYNDVFKTPSVTPWVAWVWRFSSAHLATLHAADDDDQLFKCTICCKIVLGWAVHYGSEWDSKCSICQEWGDLTSLSGSIARWLDVEPQKVHFVPSELLGLKNPLVSYDLLFVNCLVCRAADHLLTWPLITALETLSLARWHPLHASALHLVLFCCACLAWRKGVWFILCV